MQLANGYDDIITCDVEGKWSNAENKIAPWCESESEPRWQEVIRRLYSSVST